MIQNKYEKLFYIQVIMYFFEMNQHFYTIIIFFFYNLIFVELANWHLIMKYPSADHHKLGLSNDQVKLEVGTTQGLDVFTLPLTFVGQAQGWLKCLEGVVTA